MCKNIQPFLNCLVKRTVFQKQSYVRKTESYTEEIAFKSVFGLALMSSVLLIFSMQKTLPNSLGFQITSFKFLFSPANFIAMHGRTRVFFFFFCTKGSHFLSLNVFRFPLLVVLSWALEFLVIKNWEQALTVLLFLDLVSSFSSVGSFVFEFLDASFSNLVSFLSFTCIIFQHCGFFFSFVSFYF